MKSIKDFLNKLSCINNQEQNKQNDVDQYLIQEYKRLGLIEKQKFEEKEQQKLLEQKELEQKELEQKQLEQKLLGEKLLEQKQLEQKLLEEKLLEQKQLEQKLLEEKLLEEKLLEEKLLEEKLLEEELEQKLLEEKHKLCIINTVFLQYKEQYKEFYSTHHSPIHSHFNKTDFVELCNTMNFNNEIELIDKLNDYNNKKRQDTKAYKNLSTKRRLKCDVFTFYLFI